MVAHNTEPSLRQQLRSRLAVPVVAAPMYLCSGPDLAYESCAGGIVGTLTLNHCRDVGDLDGQIRSVVSRLARLRGEEPDRTIGPLAVNTSLGLDATTTRELLETCRRRGIDVLITANGDPHSMVAAAHDLGIAVVHDVTSLRFADKALAAGVDGMVAIGAGGGGHSGTLSPLTFVPLLRSMFDGLIVLAGTITTGAMVRAAEVLGADLAYVGTRLIATRESMAPDDYKQMLVEAGAEDLVHSPMVNGTPANWLIPSLRRAGLGPHTTAPPPTPGAGHLPDGVRPWRDLWSAGQGVSLIDDIPPAAEVIHRLRHEYVEACSIPGLGCHPPTGDEPAQLQGAPSQHGRM